MMMWSDDPDDWILHAGDGNVIFFRSPSDCGVSDMLCSAYHIINNIGFKLCLSQHLTHTVMLLTLFLGFFLGRPGGFFPSS